jgi:uncharacterized protein (DUF2147 family)
MYNCTLWGTNQNRQRLKQTVTRALVTLCLATTFAASFVVAHAPMTAAAAPAAAATLRTDRRPDRERAVAATQSSSSGYSSNSQSRPRLVRR